jgi:hypothetical protein
MSGAPHDEDGVHLLTEVEAPDSGGEKYVPHDNLKDNQAHESQQPPLHRACYLSLNGIHDFDKTNH